MALSLILNLKEQSNIVAYQYLINNSVVRARSVTWPMNASEAGGDLVLIQTLVLLFCKINLFLC